MNEARIKRMNKSGNAHNALHSLSGHSFVCACVRACACVCVRVRVCARVRACACTSAGCACMIRHTPKV
jgi:hypothetical protein